MTPRIGPPTSRRGSPPYAAKSLSPPVAGPARRPSARAWRGSVFFGILAAAVLVAIGRAFFGA